MKKNPYENDEQISETLRSGGKEPVPGKPEMTFDEWVAYGTSRDWASFPICNTHDGFPEEVDDICQHYILLYKNVKEAETSRDTFRPAAYRAYTRNQRWWNIDVD
jgi:hypothetical protein